MEIPFDGAACVMVPPSIDSMELTDVMVAVVDARYPVGSITSRTHATA